MIALLVKFYDDEKQLGIGSLSLDEGDFILEKGYENNKITYENVLKMMKLIAARKLIQVSLDDYIETIRSEFSRKTHNEGQNNTLPLINRSLSASMTLEEIETGIEIGYRLREKQKGEIPKKHL